MEQFLLKALLIAMAPFMQLTSDYSGDHVYYCKSDYDCVRGMLCYDYVCTPEELVPVDPVDPVDPVEPGGGADCSGGTCLSDADCIPGLFCICVGDKRECRVINE